MFIFSQHFTEQMQLRNISLEEVQDVLNKEEVQDVLNNPEQIITEDDLQVYQKLVYLNSKQYMLRIL